MVAVAEMKPCRFNFNRVSLEKQNIKVKGNKGQERVQTLKGKTN